MKKSKMKKVFSGIISGVVIALITAVLIALLLGMRFYSVQTGSMYPTYPVGTMVLVEPAKFDDISKGDVITFQLQGSSVVTHRVVGIDKENRLLETKGDNNNTKDGVPVRAKDLIGRVRLGIPLVGYAALFIRTLFGKIVLGVILLAVIFIPLMIGKRNDDKEEQTEKNDE